jgi:hypothetical protein
MFLYMASSFWLRVEARTGRGPTAEWTREGPDVLNASSPGPPRPAPFAGGAETWRGYDPESGVSESVLTLVVGSGRR